MNQKTAKIIFSEEELDKLIWALTIVKTMRLPIEPDWKKPYKTLLKELKLIKENLTNLEREEPTKEEFYGKKATNTN
jgi:hypothetical protein|tara:strand:+ start:312 stop:542 length:231 start_codon:yes stop_codon:yes gene_type:complete